MTKQAVQESGSFILHSGWTDASQAGGGAVLGGSSWLPSAVLSTDSSSWRQPSAVIILLKEQLNILYLYAW